MKLQPSKDLEINTNKINEELKKQAKLFYAYCKEKIDLKTKIKYEKLDLQLLESFKLKTIDTSKLRAKEIEALLNQDDEIIKKKESIIDLESDLEDFENIIKSLVQKHECLKEISMNQRREIID